ncbi:MAG: GHKL domain-containing protein, partial [Clostridia bacterium]|nr:GHKL domain-containing protein [Clostridia bacterium]
QKNANRMIICKNTIQQSVLKDNKRLLSTKKEPDVHGLGHQIVEATAEKYQGMVDYFEEDDMFGVQVMLPMDTYPYNQ